MLRPLAPALWCLETTLRVAPGFHLPLRTTIVRRDEGSLWIHSPIALDEAAAAAIDELGPVRDIVAPSLLHHLFAGHALARWPGARLHAPARLAAKRPDLTIDAPLAQDERWPELAIVAIDGAPRIDEFVFVHHPTRTLIVTDLLFHVHDSPSATTKLILWLGGAWNRLAQDRVWRLAVRDRAAFRASGERLLACAFERLVPAHGEVIEGPDTHAAVRAALAWMLAGR
jgi:hypothetical protein